MSSESEAKVKKRRPKPGDVFIIKPWEGENIFYYGKVIKTKIQNKDGLIKGSNLVYVYDKCVTEIQPVEELETAELLLPPMLLWNDGWTSGYLQVVDSLPVTESELSLDYGLQHITTKKYLNEEGVLLTHEPTYKGRYGITNHFAIERYIQKKINN